MTGIRGSLVFYWLLLCIAWLAGCSGDGSNGRQCDTTADCATYEDEDLCNGTLICNQDNGRCELDPATVVECPNEEPCLQKSCNPETGDCETSNLPEGTDCDADDDDCTIDKCNNSGQCVYDSWDPDCGAPPPEDDCDDTVDNDHDGQTDCDDPDCQGDPACGVPGPEDDCDDTVDNDQDGQTDCDDPDCQGDPACP